MHRTAITSTRTILLAASFPRICISSFLSFYVSFNGKWHGGGGGSSGNADGGGCCFFFGYGSHDPIHIQPSYKCLFTK